MASKYDPVRDLAEMVAAGIACRNDACIYAGRIAERLGLGEDDTMATVGAELRKALGLKPCTCGIDGGPGLVVPYACPVHGTPCDQCGGLENCEDWCGADPVGTVTDLRSGGPVTVWRDGESLVVPALRLDAPGCATLRQVINNEIADLADARRQAAP